MELLTVSLLRAPHGFPTREGGASRGVFASLNGSLTVGDLPEAVEENLARIARAAGVEPGRLATVSQVHGDAVWRVTPAGLGGATEADALWTDEPGTAVGVRTADCVPILIEDAVGRRVAAVHAGWRGVVGGTLGKAIAALEAAGSRRGDLRVAIGPCAQACCFEVDGGLPQTFERAFGGEVVVAVPGKAKVHLDLPRALRVSLGRLGLGADQVAVLPQCTMCDPRFFSHRRDQGRTGRHLSFITCQFPSAAVPRPFS